MNQMIIMSVKLKNCVRRFHLWMALAESVKSCLNLQSKYFKKTFIFNVFLSKID
jgi:hypothetical protein